MAAAGGPGGMGGAGGMPSMEQAKAEQEKRVAMEEQRRTMLVAILSPEARSRLQRVAMVKPDKARQVEQFLLQQHAGKAMADKVPESAVIRLLESLAGQEAKAAPKVRVQRVGVLEEDDDGFDEDDF